LQVAASISALIRAVDKEFSLSANYPKGHGELFLAWIKEYYPGVLLLHVASEQPVLGRICVSRVLLQSS
jgi:hypothetical protein